MNLPDFLQTTLFNSPKISPAEVLIRLVAALALGLVVAWIYRRTRKTVEVAGSFPVTLVLLAVLIAMVTQVIGDNVARAFSLVGALSIVRFRTVVRDTQDTAYVIFAVVVGMAVGASDLWVGVIGIGVVGFAAWLMSSRVNPRGNSSPAQVLHVRLGLGHDLEKFLGPTFDLHLQERELISVATAKQGVFLDVTYHARLRPNGSAHELITAVNRLEGVQGARLERQSLEEN